MAAWLALAAAAAAVVVVLVVTRRPAPAPLPDRAGYLRRWGELHGGYDAGGSGLVGGVLSAVYVIARPFARAGVLPNALTMVGPVVAGAAVPLAGGSRPERVGAALVVAASGIFDNLDGALAVLTGRDSRLGYVLDSVVDRIADGLWFLALWRAGAGAGAVLGAAAAVMLLEYTRARAAAAGMQEVGVVTIAERPTRMLLVAFTLLGSAVLWSHSADVCTAGAAALLAVTVAGIGQLAKVVVRRLA